MSTKEDNKIAMLQPYIYDNRGKVIRNKEYTKHYGKVKDLRLEEHGDKQESEMDEREQRKNHIPNKIKYYV